MSELRARAKVLYNALNFDTPVNFGQDELVKGLGPEKYVENLHGAADRDPVRELADQIDLSDSAGAYLFTGNRGTGKTTELLRLATILHEYDCEVFYADMAEYLTLTQRIEITDFLISVLGAFSRESSGPVWGKSGQTWVFRAGVVAAQRERGIYRDQIPSWPDRIQSRPAAKSDLQRAIADQDLSGASR